MFNFLKNKKKIIVFDIGSQKIGAILYKLVNNKPMIIDMEYKKIVKTTKNQIFCQKISERFMKKFQVLRKNIQFIVI